jgi:hypothetical protein
MSESSQPSQPRELVTVALDLIRPDPRNANVLDPVTYKKVRDHIDKTKNYPPLIVRELPHSSRFYDKKSGGTQLMYLDGHHRSRMLMELGYEEATCDNWGEMADDTAGVYLVSTNGNMGDPDAMRLGALFHDVSATISLENLAAIVPYEVLQIQELVDLQQESFLVDIPQEVKPETLDEPDVATYRRYALFPKQERTVSMAMTHVMQDMEGQNKEGRALEELCVNYLSGLDPLEYGMLEARYQQELTTARESDPLEDDEGDEDE